MRREALEFKLQRDKKNILILGASGFIGSQLTEYLFGKGYSIFLFFRGTNSSTFDYQGVPGPKVIYGDYANRADVKRALEKINVVVNLIPSCAFKNENRNDFSGLSKSISADIAFIEECNFAGVQRVIFASSGGTVYGGGVDGPVSEKNLTNPESEYGLSKLFFEQCLYLNSLTSNLQYTVLRISNPYGVGQSPFKSQGVIAKFMWKLIRNEEIEIYGDILSGRDYIYVSDLIRAFEIAINIEHLKSNTYNVGSGVLTTLEDLIAQLSRFSSADPRVKYVDARRDDIHTNFLDASLSAAEMNWRPTVGLEEGLLLTYEYLSSITYHG